MTQTYTHDYEHSDGRAVRLTFAEPDQAVRGGLVVLHEAGGVTDVAQSLVSALAAEGWIAVAPHVDGLDTALVGAAVLEATDTTFAWLVERGVRGDLLGVVGFDLGGTAALVVAAQRTVGAAVSVGGRGIGGSRSAELPELVEIAGRLTSPWLGMYGDDGDDAGESAVERLRDAAAAATVATHVIRYPGVRHWFDDDSDAAADAWQRTLAWFDAHLR